MVKTETPLEKAPESVQALANGEVYFKREDLSEAGSFKIRSLTYQMSLLKQKGIKEAIIPTSGNAGIAAAIAAKKGGYHGTRVCCSEYRG